MELSPETQLRTLQVLRAIWNEVDSPAEVGTSPDASQQSLLYAEALARRLGLIPESGSGSGMATVTFSIGTDARDYSTITAWEADLDNGALYSSSDDAVGECYNDSAFDESVTINGGGTVGLSSITLSVASGERHDGTAGSGARIARSSGAGQNSAVVSAAVLVTIEWLEIDGGGNASECLITTSAFGGDGNRLANLIVHGNEGDAVDDVIGIGGQGGGAMRDVDIVNCVVYRIHNTRSPTSTTAVGIDSTVSTLSCEVYNCTVYDIESDASNAFGVIVSDLAAKVVRNTICTGISASGTAACFSPSSPSNAGMSYNLSSDATATGTGSLTNKSAGDQFVSIVGGSEDLHLKAGADAIDAGTDLGTTPSGVEIDIDGRDRDANGDTWDIGADEFVAVGGGATAGRLINGGLVNAGLINRGLVG